MLTATRRVLLMGLAATAAAPLIGCTRPTAAEPKLVSAAGVSRAKPSPDAPVEAAVEGLIALGHKVLRAAAEPGRNFVLSPLSLAVAFAMARVGARGATAQELDAVFGFPAAGRDEAFNAITSRLVTVDSPPRPDPDENQNRHRTDPPVVSIGDALFPQKGFPIGADFLRTLAEQYGAGVRPVDFEGDAAGPINAWVDRQTAGRITKLFDTIPQQTKLVLANTVYFKADWRRFFTTTADMPFTKADGTRIQTATLKDSRRVRYAETGAITAIELAYAEGPYAMWLMLAPPGGQPEDALTSEVLGRLRDSFTETAVEIAVPKWAFQNTIELKKVLPGLGLTSAFTLGDADFRGIAPELFIHDALQTADISVDEWGTVASAVTGMMMAQSGPPPATARFIADRPFAFAIVGGEDHIPLFVGRVCDPTAR